MDPKFIVFILFILIAIALALLAMFVIPGIITPPHLPGSLNVLPSAERIYLNQTEGPEGMAFDASSGGPYTGVADGRILKWDGANWVEFAVSSNHREGCHIPITPEMELICGRPLGLRFHPNTGDLYFADSSFGLNVVGPEGGLASHLVTEIEGHPPIFVNDVEIDDEENVVYFSEATTVHRRWDFMQTIMSQDTTGMLLKYDISTKEVTVVLRNLTFPNGLELSMDRSFLLIAETSASRLLRFWLHGPNAGILETFAELPGLPDNIRRNSEGEFWVALHSKNGLVQNWVLSNPWFGNLILQLPLTNDQLHDFLVGFKPHATAIKLSNEGEVLQILEDVDGKTLRLLSEVEEKNGNLWFGSALEDFLGVYNLEQSTYAI